MNVWCFLCSGKVNNYCRYAFAIFDSSNNGTLNFCEYVRAMNTHDSDDVEESLALVHISIDMHLSACKRIHLYVGIRCL
jgi:hypothetical protein